MHKSKSTFMLAGAISILVVLLAACGTSSSTSGNNGNGTYDFSYHYKPPTKTGGTVVFGSNAAADSSNYVVNANLNNTVYDSYLDNALYQGCIVQLPDLTLGAQGWVNDGCTSVTPSTDSSGGTVITAKLDPQAKFSDGTPVTSADYRLAFDAAQDPNVGGGALSPPYDKATVAFPDPQTIVISYHQAYAPWRVDLSGYHAVDSAQYPDSFTPSKYTAGDQISFAGGSNPGKPDPSYNSTVFQADIGAAGSNSHTTTDTTMSIGSGPFQLDGAFTDGTVTTFKPNTNYHSNYFHAPAIAKLVYKNSTDANAEALAYEAGQYDAAFDFNLTNLQSLSGVPQNEIIDAPAASEEYFFYNQRDAAPNATGTSDHHSIFAQENVRKAFEEAFNKNQAVATLFGVNPKDPTVFTDQFVPQVDPSYDKTAPEVKFDPADANKLMQGAGFKLDAKGIYTYPGTSTEVSVVIAVKNNRPVRESMVTLMKDELESNLHVKAQTLLSSKVYSAYGSGGIFTTGAYDIGEAGYVGYAEWDQNSATFDPTQIPSKTNQAGPNWAGVNDTTLTGFLTQGRTTLDPAQRLTIYHQANTYLLEHAIYWGAYATPNISLAKTTLINYKSHSTQQGFNWNVADWWTESGNS